MIANTLQAAARRVGSLPFVVDRDKVWSYADSCQAVRQIAHALTLLNANHIIAYMDDSADLIHLMIAASLAGKSFTIANRLSSTGELKEICRALDADLVVTPQSVASLGSRQCSVRDLLAIDCEPGFYDPNVVPDKQGEVVILTSGTTGRPKCAAYSWDRLLSQVQQRDDQKAARWVLLYQLNHFAGFQMVSHVIANAACLVIPPSLDVAEVAAAIDDHCVTHASGTPTFWRVFAGLRREGLPSLRQITLGGEAASGDLLQKLGQLFPNATITQVYATTELGSCFSTSDGLPGFPASLLEDDARPIKLKIVDGELYVRPVSGMHGYVGVDGPESTSQDRPDEWRPTGDLVEQVDDRFFFRGRASETINVGGVKVNPVQVEECILSVTGVLAARVFGRPNPVTGAIVEAEIVCIDEALSGTIVEAVRGACQRSLTRYQRPRSIEVVPSLATVNRKVRRHTTTSAFPSAQAPEHAS